MFGFGFTTPLEFGVNFVYLFFIFSEIVLSYQTAKSIAHAQTIQFFAVIDQSEQVSIKKTEEIPSMQ
jgi:hypothetical protein